MSQQRDHDREFKPTSNPRPDLQQAPGRSSASAALDKPNQPIPSGITAEPVAGNDAIAEAIRARANELSSFDDLRSQRATHGENATPNEAAPTPDRKLGSAIADPTGAAAHGERAADAERGPPPAPEPETPRVVQRIAGSESIAPEGAHAIAAHGTTGAGGALPHLEQVQAAFGRHDVSGVRAHTGGEARTANARLGARAFAAGDAVAFATVPDLHTAAHEAAHVVQQRSGAVPADGLGRPGDALEQHADRVADHVVAGDSAEAVLDEVADTGTARSAVQLEVDPKGPSSFVGAEVAALYKHLPAVASSPQRDERTGGTAEPVRVERPPSAGSQTFFTKGRGVDATPLGNVNTARKTLETTISTKGAAIDAALARDKASGVMLDPGLETAINSYKAASGRAKAAATELRGVRGQCDGLDAGILASMKAAKAAKEKERAENESQEEEEAATADVAATRALIGDVADASVDTVATIAKFALVSPEDTASAIIDTGAAWAKVGLQLWNRSAEEAETAAVKERVKAKWAAIKDAIDEDTAAAAADQVAAVNTQIASLKTQAEGIKERLKAEATQAVENMATIMKAKDKVTALAEIQAYITAVTAGADDLNSAITAAEPIFDWDFQGTGDEMKVNINSDLADAESAYNAWFARKPIDRPSSMLTSSGLAAHEAEYSAWERQARALVEWVTQTQQWFTTNRAELAKEGQFVSGPHLEKAEQALATIADLGEG